MMAYEDDDEYPQATSQTGMGLAQNPLMPMGDPLAYARVGAAPETNAPGIHTQGVAPQPIVQPRPINVPDIPVHKEGAESTNDLMPSTPEPTTAGPNINSLQGLLQMKGLSDLATPSAAAVSAPGAGLVPAPGAGAGPGRVPTGVSIEKAAAPYQDMVNDAADKNGLDRNMFRAQLYQESKFDPSAKSPAGAQGIGQFMPATAKERGVDVNDPKSSIYGAASYLGELKKKYGNDQQALAAYNWGPGNVDSWLKTGKGLKGPLPDETKNYVQTITGKPLVPTGGPTSQIEPKPPAANDPDFLMKYRKWMEDRDSNSDEIRMGPSAPPTSTPPVKHYPTVGPMSGTSMFTQTEQPFKPYRIAGTIQPPPTSSTTAPAVFGEHKPGQTSPYGGPYTTVQADGSQYATDANGKIVGPPIKDITTPKFDKNNGVKKEVPGSEKTLPVTGGAGNDQGTPNLGGGVSQPAINPDKVVPAATPPVETKPGQDQPQQQVPGQTGMFGPGSDPAMQKLWKFMLIKSLFPQIQFRNIGYDPWAVHRFGQGGGY
jgi:transglycosylase-like protein with SLT domain